MCIIALYTLNYCEEYYEDKCLVECLVSFCTL